MVDLVHLESLIHKEPTPLYALSSLGTCFIFSHKLKARSPQSYHLPNSICLFSLITYPRYRVDVHIVPYCHILDQFYLTVLLKKKKLSTTKHTCTSVGHARNPSSSHFLYLSDPKLPAYSISPTTLLSPSFCRLMFFKLYVHFSYLGDLVRFRFWVSKDTQRLHFL